MDTDASNDCIGAVLSQIQPGEDIKDAKVIAFGSKTLTEAECRYDARNKEILAIVHFLEYYRYYLEGKPFHVQTDHESLKWLLNQKKALSGQEARWSQKVWSFPIIGITHKAGKTHCNADALS